MKVKDLKELLKNQPEDRDVLISLTGEFDGRFVSPCIGISGEAEMGLMSEEDEKEAKLLNKPVTDKKFILVRCGFFQEDSCERPELN